MSCLPYNSQGESRELMTLLATIYADGTCLPPALIFGSTSNDIQNSWVEDFSLVLGHNYFFSASLNGWTNNELGFDWLVYIFDSAIREKARRSWRPLFLDSHNFHVTLTFLEWCLNNRILVAYYPPHATHQLQPLNVGLFSPLGSFIYKD